MAVQIPRLQRITPSPAQPTNTRIQGQATSQAPLIQTQTQAATSLVNQGADLFQQFEDDKISQLSNEAEQEYSEWNVQKLQELKTFKGDPTDAYAQYEIDAQEKFDGILNNRADASERVKRHLRGNLAKVQDSQRIRTLKQRGMQIETYKNNLFNSTVKLKKNNLSVNAGYIRKDDPSSFSPFDTNLNEIRTLIAKRSLENGSATKLDPDAKSWTHLYTDEDGTVTKVNLNDNAKLMMAKEMSEGVSTSIKNLINAGQLDNAKLMQERYKGYLNGKQVVKIKEKSERTQRSDTAYAKLDSYRGMTDADINKKINEEPDGRLRDKMRDIQAGRTIHRERQRKIKFDRNYNTMFDELTKLEKAGQPILTKEDLVNNPVFKGLEDEMSPNDKKSLFKQVSKPPATSKPKDIVNVQNTIFDGENTFQNMSAGEVSKLTASLRQVDRDRYRRMWEEMQTGESKSFIANVNFANKLAQDTLSNEGDLDYDWGKLDDDSKEIMSKVRTMITTEFSENPNIERKDIQDRVESLIKRMRVSGILERRRRRSSDSRAFDKLREQLKTDNQAQTKGRDDALKELRRKRDGRRS